MTLYLTDTMSPEEIKLAKESGVVCAVKLYPAGATTNSQDGVTDLFGKCLPVLEEMMKQNMPLLMSNRTDPAWKYSKRHEDNKFRFTCNFCDKVVTGSVYRVKLHLVGGYPDVTSCPNCPEPVKEEIRAFI
ncbi:hypothetical protein RHMOL_Rhmol06G0202200 [Rhododendron molle]|nr:hypothetical protein RHMOL_Rhmol06G0202200 [Rhododendron molle]KAI8551646.1 hypothetical protein RHMOL_Rhmol06G0202200 [Rhododendron molle]KAI8551647.1 hypothetical protein RHMOL_Rhmol06G0202200 [Rhododendron molle]KAI8551648.1 hypothetical protein RHMOL_Rhmol06G0202200 [Rhododendron molle]